MMKEEASKMIKKPMDVDSITQLWSSIDSNSYLPPSPPAHPPSPPVRPVSCRWPQISYLCLESASRNPAQMLA
jgi:hypothetical protein